MQEEQSAPIAYCKPAPALAGALLVLAGAATYSPGASHWGCICGKQLIDAMIALANAHGFAQTGELHALLASGAQAEHIYTLANVAFNDVPLPKLLVTIRRTRLHTDLRASGASEDADT